jgi:hypothetical protein
VKLHRVTVWREIGAWERFLEWLWPARRARRIARNRAEMTRVRRIDEEVKFK